MTSQIPATGISAHKAGEPTMWAVSLPPIPAFAVWWQRSAASGAGTTPADRRYPAWLRKEPPISRCVAGPGGELHQGSTRVRRRLCGAVHDPADGCTRGCA